MTANMDEIYEFTMRVASGQRVKEEVVSWVRQYTTKRESED